MIKPFYSKNLLNVFRALSGVGIAAHPRINAAETEDLKEKLERRQFTQNDPFLDF